MKIILANKIRLKKPPEHLRDILIQQCRLPNPKFKDAVEHGYWTGNIDQYINNFTVLPDESLLLPRGLRAQLFELCNDLGIEAEVEDKRKLFEHKHIESSRIKLRPYQAEAIHQLITVGEEGLLVSKAGSGKTVMGLALVPMLGQPALWLTHTGPLAEQALERIKQFLELDGDDVGYIGNSKWKVGNKITVAMVQTLAKRPVEVAEMKDNFGLVILDEAHHAPATTFTNVMGSFNSYYMYGLTATPYRRDNLEQLMFQTVGPINYSVPMDDIMDYGGIIIPTVIKRDVISPKVIVSDDYQKIIKELVYDTHRNRMIVDDVTRDAKAGNICVLLTDRKVHAEVLYNIIRVVWPKTAIATGNYSKKYVKEQIQRLESGEITVLIATAALLGEGFDYAPLNRCYLGLPFRNQTKIEQIIGRIQRPAEGKTDAVLYDYVDNHGLLRHQFYNTGSKGCRYDVYRMLGADVRQG